MARGNGKLQLRGPAAQYEATLRNPKSREDQLRAAIKGLNRMGIIPHPLPNTVTVTEGAKRVLQLAKGTETSEKSDARTPAPPASMPPAEGITSANPKLYIPAPGGMATHGRQIVHFRNARSPAERAKAVVNTSSIGSACLQQLLYVRTKPIDLDSVGRTLAYGSVASELAKHEHHLERLHLAPERTVRVLPEDNTLVITEEIGQFGRSFEHGQNGSRQRVSQLLTLTAEHWLLAPGVNDVLDPPEPNNDGLIQLRGGDAEDVISLVPVFIGVGGRFIGSTLTLRRDVSILPHAA